MDEWVQEPLTTKTNVGEVMEALTYGIFAVGMIAAFLIGKGMNKDDGSQARSELREMNKDTRDTIQATVVTVVKELGEEQQKHLSKVGESLANLQVSNEKKLDEMRVVVDEKLQETLDKRITESFKLVGERLQSVQTGLGEMKSLATDVGGLKKVLANVSTRGAMGELQAEQVLEDFLDHSQYSKNVQTNPNYNGTVEFAIRLPGDGENRIWLPIDCKFPREDYEILIDAQNAGDKDVIEKATKSLVANIKGKAKDIRSKYISPPQTTDFAIMFLATEGLYAEVARQPGLIQELRQKHRISVCGPTNLMAFVDSMRMGFRTLALQAKAVEVWSVLGDVKNEMEKFGSVVQKAHKQALTVANTLGGEGDGMQRRLRALERSLRDVETLDAPSETEPNLLED